MKNFKRILALVLAVMMVATSLMVVTSAAEEKVDYIDEAIVRLNKLDIVQGKTDGLEPDDNITRAEAAQLVGRLMTGKVDSHYWDTYLDDTTFEDLGAAEWAIGAISFAYEQGVVKGKSDVRFDPMGNVTYQDILTMVVRSLGYTGQSYPNGFINKAMKLGLTNGISGLKYTDAAPRGVVATVIYNALYAEDSLFAENFNLTSGNYMLVATPSVKINSSLTLPGAEISGYVGKKLNEGYVAFAKIGEDYRAINNNYVYAKTSQISDDIKGNFADKLGYAYELTFENDELTWGDQCYTEVFENYGDDRDIDVEYVEYNHLYNGNTIVADNGWFLKFGDQVYNLVDKYDADYTAPTGAHNIILYSDFGAPVAIEHYDFLFNDNGDIVDVNGKVVLEYKDGAYYVENANGVSRKATSDEIAAAISEIAAKYSTLGYNFASDYAMIEQGDAIADSAYLGTDKDIVDEFYKDDYDVDNAINLRDAVLSIARNYFCEITAMDYDNDGTFDAAIYTPYYFGSTGTVGTTFSLGGAIDENGAQALKSVKTADYVVTGEDSKLSDWGMYLYTFNRHTNTIDIKEVANQKISGDVEWAVKGKVSKAGIYEDSQVKIGDTVYDIGGWAIDNLLGLYTIRDYDGGHDCSEKVVKQHWAKVPYVVSLLDVDGNGKVDDDEKPTFTDWDGCVVTGYNGWYYNGWNDVLEVGMTDACTGFKGVELAGHIIHGVPTPKAAATATYKFVTFNPYQSTFAVENDQIVVDAMVDASGEYKTIKINSIEGEEFTDVEFAIFCEYIEAFYGDNANNIKYSYFFDAERKAAHQATALYKAIERDFIIDLLVATVDVDGAWDAAGTAKETSNVYSVLGTNADGSYQLSILTPATIATDAVDGRVTFSLGVSSKPVAGEKLLSVDKDTVWTFVAKDGIYTYTGVPTAKDTLVLSDTAKFYVVNSDNVMLFDLDHCIEEICVGEVTWNERVQDINLIYAPMDHVHYEELVNADDANACEYIIRKHVDTWALNEYEYTPYVSKNFLADEVYMVTEKTANTKIYNDGGVMLYVYSNLYNLIDNKYEESVIFSGAEVEVFKQNGIVDVWYEDGTGEVSTNYGAIIARDSVKGVSVFTVADLKDPAKASKLFNLDAMATGTYKSQLKDNNDKLAQMTFDVYDEETGAYKETSMTVKSATFITVYGSGKNVTVGDFSKLAEDATVFYTYDKDAGVITGYAFN